MQQQLVQADAARIATEEAGAKLQAELDRQLKDSQAALAAAKAEAQAREAEIRVEAQQAAQAAVAERLAEIERDRVQAETALRDRIKEVECVRLAAEQKGANLQGQLDQLRRESAAAIDAVKAEAQVKEAEIRSDAQQAAQAAVAEQLTACENTRLKSEAALRARITEIEASKTAVEQQKRGPAGAARRTAKGQGRRSRQAEGGGGCGGAAHPAGSD